VGAYRVVFVGGFLNWINVLKSKIKIKVLETFHVLKMLLGQCSTVYGGLILDFFLHFQQKYPWDLLHTFQKYYVETVCEAEFINTKRYSAEANKANCFLSMLRGEGGF
jgi:hypothetical protein